MSTKHLVVGLLLSAFFALSACTTVPLEEKMEVPETGYAPTATAVFEAREADEINMGVSGISPTLVFTPTTE